MNQKILFLLTLVGILILIFLAQNPSTQIGTIKSIQVSKYKTTIKLQNDKTELILFESINLNLTKGDKIKFQGKPDIYKNKKQIIISKIYLL